MVKLFPKHSHFAISKSSKERTTELTPEGLSLGFKELKNPEPHTKGHCKICHKDVKNIEDHMKRKHREAKS